MYVAFDALPENARIWIYQSDRIITAPERTIIEEEAQLFTGNWSAHGHALRASFQLLHDHFLILAVDEASHPPSGCSIDESVRFMKRLGERVNIDFFNRSIVAFLRNEEVALQPLKALGAELQAGTWNERSLVFNNVISSKGQLQHEWVVPAAATWLSRMLLAESRS